jgi:hypothetical protein
MTRRGARHLRMTGFSFAVPASGWLLSTSAVCCSFQLVTRSAAPVTSVSGCAPVLPRLLPSCTWTAVVTSGTVGAPDVRLDPAT